MASSRVAHVRARDARLIIQRELARLIKQPLMSSLSRGFFEINASSISKYLKNSAESPNGTRRNIPAKENRERHEPEEEISHARGNSDNICRSPSIDSKRFPSRGISVISLTKSVTNVRR